MYRDDQGKNNLDSNKIECTANQISANSRTKKNTRVATQNNFYNSIHTAMDHEICNMNNSVKMNVQLLSQSNMLQVKKYIVELSEQLEALLEEHNIIVKEQEMQHLVYQNLYDVLKAENEHLFHIEFNLIHATNDILKEQLHQTLLENDYQNCLIAMNDLLDKFQNGVHNTTRVIMLQSQIEQLNYQLATIYKLHADIKLYMEAKKIVECYKENFHQMFFDSLLQLQYDNVKNAVQLKDNIMVRLQQQRYHDYDTDMGYEVEEQVTQERTIS